MLAAIEADANWPRANTGTRAGSVVTSSASAPGAPMINHGA
jgi:hypothetical protein